MACLAVNDPFVMNEWSKMKDPSKSILMLGDGGAAFTKAAGLDFDTGGFGGVRCTRCAFVVKDGVVQTVNMEAGGAFEGASSAETILATL